MKFNPPLQKALFKRRYKRFLVDVELPNGQTITAHCPNTGSMKNCLVPDSACWLSHSLNAKRKYAFTWEIATAPQRAKAGVNTARANALVAEAIASGVITELQGYRELRQEVAFGTEASRVDIVLTGHARRKQQSCFVEVKNVTYAEKNGQGFFPDAVSERGQKHLRELMSVAAQGERAVLLFCVQHSSITQVAPADHIDPVYGRLLRQAARVGVEIIAYRAKLSAREIVLTQKVPVRLDLDSRAVD